jgi:hypothetical protein
MRRMLAVVVLAGLASAASAQIAPPKPDPNVQHVALVRQDFSDCSNGNVSDRDPSLIGGAITVARGAGGTTKVQVDITASPDTT